ncbi:hypothetical protein CKO25_17430 [Thiocapsa imhoffii]|uniref:Phytochrome chromophore attachment site domain-containing protein n=1 Tax=Thiocapsa imhoffii TaxID=382777 RepID=A0A9X0WKI1_9GAMM|nr:GAF domain-containing protein [Thiocapsa imhoffii]MBK1646394.1 hypothetical protein [Thiocapsa imhoffii]
MSMVTIADCEHEQLAHSGHSQGFGVLLFLAKQDMTFRYVSANSAELLGEDPAELLGADGRDWLEMFLPDLGVLPKGAGKRAHWPRALDLGFGELDVLISPTSDGWLLEFETALDLETNPEDFQLASWSAPLNSSELEQVQQSLVEAISGMTGYDRVMLYQFTPDWSGEVLAERVRRSAGTYLSLRFPATDIPAIARKLYAQTPYRHIPDVTATPVPILAQQGEGTALDLTWSDLRSVSPMHVEYLSNMNVGSSFSTSVMVEGRLWGLVACHNPEPRRIPLQARQRCKALVDAYVEALLSHRRSIERSLLETLSTQLEPVRAQLAQGVAIADSLASQFQVLSRLLGVSGGAVAIGDELAPLGPDALPAEMLRDLHQWCRREMSDTLYCTDHLAGAWDKVPEPFPFCGLLSLSMRAKRLASGHLYLYVFRPEEVSEVAWAGNPEKPMEASGEGVRISPRKSFERWVQVRRGFSRGWSDQDLFVARQLRDQLSAWI